MNFLKIIVLCFFACSLVYIAFFSEFDNRKWLIISFSCCLIVWGLIFYRKPINKLISQKENETR